VACGDLDGDGKAEIVTGPGTGGGSHLRVWKVSGGAFVELIGVLIYPAGYTGGVQVAVGDADGRRPLEIITGAGPGGGPHVQVLKLGVLLLPNPVYFLLTDVEFLAYDAGFVGGVFPAGFRP
jgi:hypothetical protein